MESLVLVTAETIERTADMNGAVFTLRREYTRIYVVHPLQLWDWLPQLDGSNRVPRVFRLFATTSEQ